MNIVLFSLCASIYALQCGSIEGLTVTTTTLASTVKTLEWISPHHLVTVTETGAFLGSTDGGATWKEEVPGNIVDAYAENAGVFAFDAHHVYVKMDGAASFEATEVPGTVVRIVPHDTLAMVLVGIMSPACGSGSGVCKSSLVVVAEGQVSTLATDVRQFEWGAAKTVFASTWDDQDPLRHTYQRNSRQLALKRIDLDDPAMSWSTVKSGCAGFVVTTDALWVAAYPEGSLASRALELHYAGDLGREPLERFEFPSTLAQDRYTILNAESHSIYINVQHGDSAWGNIYVGTRRNHSHTDDTIVDLTHNEQVEKHVFTLSLERAARYLDGTVEFAKFQGLPGTFVANVFDDGSTTERLTVMTHDNGGQWSMLTPPSQSVGNTPSCVGSFCHLHVHGIRKSPQHRRRWVDVEYGPLHTKRNSVGLGLATGNVGTSLDNAFVGVYLTRTGGLDWTEIANGSHTYDFADHGALMMIARNDLISSDVEFSWNQFETSTTCSHTPGIEFAVHDVVADPNAIGERFVVYGEDRLTMGGVIVSFDFSTFHKRACVDEDYEIWSPDGVKGTKCVLGREIGFRRRKQLAECYNKEVLEAEPISKICACTRDDYACAECYEPVETRDFSSVHCVPMEDCFRALYNGNATDIDIAKGIVPPDDCNNSTYFRTRGYALVADTECRLAGGLDLTPEKLTCPGATIHNRGGKGGVIALTILLVLIAVIVAGGLAFVVYRRSQAPPSVEYGILDDTNEDDFFEKQEEEEDEELEKKADDFNPRK